MLDPPTYLDCVVKGDKVRFKWVLHNNSTKPYGIDSILQRAAATKLSDPSLFFTLTYATADKPDEAIDDLSEIEPQSMITIDQDFSVNPNTMEYSEGNLSLELMLSDPKTGAMRSVQRHVMHIQISSVSAKLESELSSRDQLEDAELCNSPDHRSCPTTPIHILGYLQP